MVFTLLGQRGDGRRSQVTGSHRSNACFWIEFRATRRTKTCRPIV
jgi:hypothetical protein